MYLELLCDCADLEKLSNTIHGPLVVEVAHPLDVSVVLLDPRLKMLHEPLMIFAILNCSVNIRERMQRFFNCTPKPGGVFWSIG